MKLRDFGLLADENLHHQLVEFLIPDVQISVRTFGVGTSDTDILASALQQNRVVVTHDRDFGALGIQSKKAYCGILYIRLGHIRPEFTIESLRIVIQRDLGLTPPFIIVAERNGTDVYLRVRQPVTR